MLSRPSHEGAEGSNQGGRGIQFVTGDLATGQGVQAAVEGTEIIVHLAGTPKGDEVKARNLVRAGVRHLVLISVVGADRLVELALGAPAGLVPAMGGP